MKKWDFRGLEFGWGRKSIQESSVWFLERGLWMSWVGWDSRRGNTEQARESILEVLFHSVLGAPNQWKSSEGSWAGSKKTKPLQYVGQRRRNNKDFLNITFRSRAGQESYLSFPLLSLQLQAMCLAQSRAQYVFVECKPARINGVERAYDAFINRIRNTWPSTTPSDTAGLSAKRPAYLPFWNQTPVTRDRFRSKENAQSPCKAGGAPRNGIWEGRTVDDAQILSAVPLRTQLIPSECPAGRGRKPIPRAASARRDNTEKWQTQGAWAQGPKEERGGKPGPGAGCQRSGGSEGKLGGELGRCAGRRPLPPNSRTLRHTSPARPTCQKLWGRNPGLPESEWQGSATVPSVETCAASNLHSACASAPAASTWPGTWLRLQLPECRANLLREKSYCGDWPLGWLVLVRRYWRRCTGLFSWRDGQQAKRVSHGVSDKKGDQHCESPRGHWSLQVTRRVGARMHSGHVGSGVRSGGHSGPELAPAAGFIRSNLARTRWTRETTQERGSAPGDP